MEVDVAAVARQQEPVTVTRRIQDQPHDAVVGRRSSRRFPSGERRLRCSRSCRRATSNASRTAWVTSRWAGSIGGSRFTTSSPPGMPMSSRAWGMPRVACSIMTLQLVSRASVTACRRPTVPGGGCRAFWEPRPLGLGIRIHVPARSDGDPSHTAEAGGQPVLGASCVPIRWADDPRAAGEPARGAGRRDADVPGGGDRARGAPGSAPASSWGFRSGAPATCYRPRSDGGHGQLREPLPRRPTRGRGIPAQGAIALVRYPRGEGLPRRCGPGSRGTGNGKVRRCRARRLSRPSRGARGPPRQSPASGLVPRPALRVGRSAEHPRPRRQRGRPGHAARTPRPYTDSVGSRTAGRARPDRGGRPQRFPWAAGRLGWLLERVPASPLAACESPRSPARDRGRGREPGRPAPGGGARAARRARRRVPNRPRPRRVLLAAVREQVERSAPQLVSQAYLDPYPSELAQLEGGRLTL